jgi:nanoRNase/pAp phosphatase (c-di-AMP/oligoRNAs hydrolase)
MPRADPDLDGIACAVSYAELLTARDQNAIAWYFGIPDGEAGFALQEFPNLDFATEDMARLAPSFVLVDSSDLDGIPEFVDPADVLEVIDHRLYTDAIAHFPKASIVIEPVGAAATMIVERFREGGVIPSEAAGILLFGAIYSNTLNLRGAITTDRDIDAALWLDNTIKIPSDWLARQYAARKSQLIENLKSSIANERKNYEHPSGEYSVSQLEFVGATQIVWERLPEIRSMLSELEPRTFANIVDIETSKSHIICPDASLRSLISEAMALVFKDDVAEVQPAQLRKQIVAALVR